MSNTNKNRIYKIQKKAIRTISNVKYNQPVVPLFAELGILPYSMLQQQACLSFMHGIEYSYCPETFRNTWSKNVNRNVNYELRNSDLFKTPRINFTYLKNSQLFYFPAEWNKLEVEVRLKATNAHSK